MGSMGAMVGGGGNYFHLVMCLSPHSHSLLSADSIIAPGVLLVLGPQIMRVIMN